jgi:hypothetical protein
MVPKERWESYSKMILREYGLKAETRLNWLRIVPTGRQF